MKCSEVLQMFGHGETDLIASSDGLPALRPMESAAVATAFPVTSKIAADIPRAGGNAVDAAAEGWALCARAEPMLPWGLVRDAHPHQRRADLRNREQLHAVGPAIVRRGSRVSASRFFTTIF